MRQLFLFFFLCITLSLNAQIPYTTSFEVLSGTDDAEEFVANGAVNLTSSDLELTLESAQQIIGIRFGNIQIPMGAKINSAYIQFTTDEIGDAETNLTIEGELSPNAETFSNAPFNISTRMRTTAQVAWDNIPGWNTGGESGLDQRTPDLTAIIQEIVDQADWMTGNALSVIISGEGKRVAVSKNNDANASAVLVVNYDLNEFIVEPFPVGTESLWRYNDDSVALDTVAWTTLEFDDSAWDFGQAKMGFGDGNEVTTLDFGSDPDNKTPTYYFRKIFSVADPSGIDSVTFSLLRDDGAIVYLNGEELFRSNMPEGEVSFSTLASTTVAGSEEDQFFNFKVPVSLMAGNNILAVEVHQATAGSSDLGFDISTTPEVTLPPAIQLVHNSPDPSLQFVSIWIDAFNTGNFINFSGALPIPFQFATDYLTDLPAGTHGVAVSTFGSTDFEWSATTITVENNKRYIVMAAGVRDTTLFNTSVNGGENIAFKLILSEVPSPEQVDAGESLPLLFHGTPDLPNLRFIAVGIGDATGDLPTGLPYGFELVGGGVDAVTFPNVQVSNNETTEIYGEYKVDLVPFEQQVLVIATSGFFSGEGNEGVNEGNFGTFFIPPFQSPFLELPVPDPPKPGTVEIIHASPDPELALVDLYVNGAKALDSLAFGASTGRIDIPVGVNRVAVSPVGMVDTSWSAFDFEVGSTLNPITFTADGLHYTAVAYGVRNTADFQNEVNTEIDFSVAAIEARLESANSEDVDILFFHGGLDAPGIDMILEGQFIPIVNNLAFGGFSPTFVSLPPTSDFILNLTDQNENEVLIKSYQLDLTGLAGKAVTIIATGNGDNFQLLLANGDPVAATPLMEVIIDNVEDLRAAGIEIYPNPVANQLQINSQSPIDQVMIQDINGRILDRIQINNTNQTIDFEGYTKGTYLVRIFDEGKVYGVRIVKQ